MKTIEQQINEFIETIRPYLKKDGGDFELVNFKDGIAYIKMLGNCASCHSSSYTIQYIEEMMCEEIPGIIQVKEV